MKTRVIAGAIILGLGAVTFALARQESGKATPRTGPADAPASRAVDRPPASSPRCTRRSRGSAPRSSCSSSSTTWSRSGSPPS